MSSKKRKNFSYSYSCDSCNAIMVQRDVNLHTEKSCPPNPDVWVHPYIIEHCLYSTLDIFELQGNKDNHCH